jgi:hypothetical protein
VLVQQGKLAKDNIYAATAGEVGKVQKLCFYSKGSWEDTTAVLVQPRRLVKDNSCAAAARRQIKD